MANIIEIVVRFLVDRQTQEAATKAVEGVGGQGASRATSTMKDMVSAYEELRTQASAANKSVSDFLASMSATETIGGRTRSDLEQITESLGKLEERATKTTDSFSTMRMGIGGFVLALYGRQLEMMGRSILEPLSRIEQADIIPTSETLRWADATERVENSIARIGVEMAEVLLPVVERSANMMENFVEFLDANPDVTKALIGIGGAFVAGGTIIRFFGDLLSVLSALTMLGVIGQGAVAKILGGLGMAGTAGAVTAGALAIGAPIGFSLGNVINVATGQPTQTPLDVWQTAGRTAWLAQVGAHAGLTRLGMEDFANRVTPQMLNLIETIFLLGDASEEAGEKIGNMPKSAVDAYIQYMQDVEAAEKKYMDRRQAILEDYEARKTAIEERANERRLTIVEAYKEEEKQRMEDLLARRLAIIRDAEEDILRMEERYQVKMRHMQEDHFQTMDELARKRDALGMVKEMRRYEQEVRRASEEHQREIAWRRRDLALRLQELEEQSRKEAIIRRKNYEERLAEIQRWEEDEKKREAERLAQKLQDLAEDHRLEMALRQRRFADILRQIDESLLGERNLRAAYYKIMAADLENFLSQYRGALGSLLPGYPVPQYQHGGYTSGGLALVHPGEFVLSADTAKAAERLAGSRLTQQNVLSLGGGGISLVQNIRFDGRISTRDREEIRKVAAEAAIEGILSVVR